MRILFDQGTPVPLRQFLSGHLVTTAAQCGWHQLRNGDLLTSAEKAGFDLLPTTDRNMPHQQNLEGRHIAVMVVDCQQWPKLRPHVHLVVQALQSCVPGSFTIVEIPSGS